jgi:hypothetical protein
MLLTEEDILEFVDLATKAGVKLSHEDAADSATRLALLYKLLIQPTPSEARTSVLANSNGDAKVKQVEDFKPY